MRTCGRVLLTLMALAIAMPSVAQLADDASDGLMPIGGFRRSVEPRDQIARGMENSAAGWNGGDVDRFLAIYSDDPATSFTGSDGIARGKASIRARYLVSYAGQFGENRALANMSKLSFTFEDFRMIGTDHALLIARWKLVKPGIPPSEQSGMTSLLFRREASGWKIIADHSS